LITYSFAISYAKTKSISEYASEIDNIAVLNAENLPSLENIKKSLQALNEIDDVTTDPQSSILSKIINSYLNAFVMESFILDYGVVAYGMDHEGNHLDLGFLNLENGTLKLITKYRNNALSVLQWFRGEYPDAFINALYGIKLYDNVNTAYSTVTRLVQINVGTYPSYEFTKLNAGTCISPDNLVLTILLNATLINDSIIGYCPEVNPTTTKKENTLFDCFEPDSNFLQMLGNSKKDVDYFFYKGSRLSLQNNLNQNKQVSAGHYCVFLGGNWKLDPKNSKIISQDSKVELFIPGKGSKTLLFEDLTLLRNQWQESELLKKDWIEKQKLNSTNRSFDTSSE
jgi:hypothetical protein